MVLRAFTERWSLSRLLLCTQEKEQLEAARNMSVITSNEARCTAKVNSSTCTRPRYESSKTDTKYPYCWSHLGPFLDIEMSMCLRECLLERQRLTARVLLTYATFLLQRGGVIWRTASSSLRCCA